MADEVKNDNVEEIVEAVAELSPEDRAKMWEKFIRDEMNGYMDIFLPISNIGDVFTSYKAHKLQTTEAGPEYSKTLAAGVTITLLLEFEKPIDVTKPRDEQE